MSTAWAQSSTKRLRVLVGAIVATVVATGSLGGLARHSGLACNRTPSLPLGLYRTLPVVRLAKRGDLVAFEPTGQLKDFVLEREYLRPGEWFFKEVLAAGGDRVCLRGGRFEVNGAVVGPVWGNDREGRPLPQTSFCGTVPDHQYWVGSRYDRSFDSRYFGPVAHSQLRAFLEPGWTL